MIMSTLLSSQCTLKTMLILLPLHEINVTKNYFDMHQS